MKIPKIVEYFKAWHKVIKIQAKMLHSINFKELTEANLLA